MIAGVVVVVDVVVMDLVVLRDLLSTLTESSLFFRLFEPGYDFSEINKYLYV